MRDKERQSTCRGGAERGRHRIRSRLQALRHQHRAGCGARTHRPRDHDPSRSRMLTRLSHPGAPTAVWVTTPNWKDPKWPIHAPGHGSAVERSLLQSHTAAWRNHIDRRGKFIPVLLYRLVPDPFLLWRRWRGGVEDSGAGRAHRHRCCL